MDSGKRSAITGDWVPVWGNRGGPSHGSGSAPSLTEPGSGSPGTGAAGSLPTTGPRVHPEVLLGSQLMMGKDKFIDLTSDIVSPFAMGMPSLTCKGTSTLD